MPQKQKVTPPESDAKDRNYMLDNSIAPKKRRVNARILRRILEFSFHFLVAAMSALAVASWVLRAAYAERGYHAFGGEWLLIIATFAVVLYFSEVLSREHE